MVDVGSIWLCDGVDGFVWFDQCVGKLCVVGLWFEEIICVYDQVVYVFGVGGLYVVFQFCVDFVFVGEWCLFCCFVQYGKCVWCEVVYCVWQYDVCI